MTDEQQQVLDRVWLILESLAVQQPGLSLRDALPIAQDTYGKVDWLQNKGVFSRPEVDGSSDTAPPTDHSPDVLGKWLGTQVDVVQPILDQKKINAIKTARALTMAGLREAKEAVEWLCDNPEYMLRTVQRLGRSWP